VSGQLHTPAALLPRGKRPRYPLDRGWVDPSASLGDVEKRKFLTLPGLKLRPLGRPACIQSLYRLRCAGSYNDRSKCPKRPWTRNSCVNASFSAFILISRLTEENQEYLNLKMLYPTNERMLVCYVASRNVVQFLDIRNQTWNHFMAGLCSELAWSCI
jgi:hypothetical protein